MSSSSVPYIGDTLRHNNILFLLLTETWLNDQLDAEVNISDYTLFRADRNRRKKKGGRFSGGVAVYVKDELAASCETLLEFSNGVVEGLVIYERQLNLVICTVYRSPDNPQSEHRSSTSEFHELINQLSNKLNHLPTPAPDIIIGGDFNLPKTDWPACTPRPGSSTAEKDMAHLLSELMSEYFLHQVIQKPTHRAGNVLDLLLTNNTNIIVNYEIFPTAPVSSHHLILCQTSLSCSKGTHEYPEELSVFDEINLKSELTNWDAINLNIGSHDWNFLFENKSVAEMLDILIKVCETAASSHSPPKPRRKRCNRIPRLRKVLMRRRTKLRRALTGAITDQRRVSITSHLIQIEREIQESYKTQLKSEEEKAVGTIKKNPKFFYSYTKKPKKAANKGRPIY